MQMTPLQLVIKSYNWIGYKYTDTDIEFMVSALNNLLNTTWKRYKIKEVDYFITLGLNGVFGNFAGISMATFCQFETAYQRHDNVHYRKEYIRLNPPEQLVELVDNTDTGKDEIVINSILTKLRQKIALQGDYIAWFDFLLKKGITRNRSLDKFRFNEEENYSPVEERYRLELLERKRICLNSHQKDLVTQIDKELLALENATPNEVEIDFWLKVMFFEETFGSEENINKLELLLTK